MRGRAPAGNESRQLRLNPDLRPRMQAMGLGVEYHRGEGDRLFTRDLDGTERSVLDLEHIWINGGQRGRLIGGATAELLGPLGAVPVDCAQP